MEPVVIVDYGMGNLHSVQKALAFLGQPSELSRDAQRIEQAQRLILPGVGAFQDAMAELNRLQLCDAIRKASASGTPLLGICLGMQLLFESSEEGGQCEGIGLLKGTITRLEADGLKVPHMGWNTVFNRDETLFGGLPPEFSVYFVHSYCLQQNGLSIGAGESDYGARFTCAVHSDNLMATQFHPEKSGDNGLRILRNFIQMRRNNAC